jgi:hypothetical protein
VLVVGRSGRKDCAALDRLLSGWDGRLTAALRKRVGRHIDRCMVCSDRRRQELKPAMLLSLAPAALLAVAAGRDPVLALAGAGTRLAGPPPGLRAEVLRLSSSTGPHAAALRAAAGRSTRSFGMNGFPKPLHHGHFGLSGMSHLPLGIIGGTAVAATATVVVTAVGPYGHHRTPAPPPGAASIALGQAPSAALSALPATPQTGATRQGPPAVAGSATTDRTSPAPSRNGAGSATASSPASASTSPAATGVAAPTSTPTAPGSGSGSGSGSGTPSPTPTTTAPSVAATLSVTPALVTLNPLLGGTLTLTATNGPVTWSLAEPPSLLGSLSVSPSSGTAYPGSPVTVALTETTPLSLDTTLTVSPGGQTVTVVLGLGLLGL